MDRSRNHELREAGVPDRRRSHRILYPLKVLSDREDAGEGRHAGQSCRILARLWVKESESTTTADRMNREASAGETQPPRPELGRLCPDCARPDGQYEDDKSSAHLGSLEGEREQVTDAEPRPERRVCCQRRIKDRPGKAGRFRRE